MDDPEFKSVGDISPVTGFDVVGVYPVKVVDFYFLHAEYIYSQKGKNVSSKIDPHLNDKVVSDHIDVPIVFAINLKPKLSDTLSSRGTSMPVPT